jgi:phosphoserine phosphatase
MERINEIDRGVATEKQRLGRAYRALQEEYRDDPRAFARRWRAVAAAWSFDDLNELIEQHNDWYPIERQLPMDPRTRDYVRFAGRSYRRPVLDSAWVLEHFPPRAT